MANCPLIIEFLKTAPILYRLLFELENSSDIGAAKLVTEKITLQFLNKKISMAAI